MAKKTNPIQLSGILGNLSGTYNDIQFCSNGVIRLSKKINKKKISDV